MRGDNEIIDLGAVNEFTKDLCDDLRGLRESARMPGAPF